LYFTKEKERTTIAILTRKRQVSFFCILQKKRQGNYVYETMIDCCVYISDSEQNKNRMPSGVEQAVVDSSVEQIAIDEKNKTEKAQNERCSEVEKAQRKS
jgi:hypothetical protein